jgi:hypothetical protein
MARFEYNTQEMRLLLIRDPLVHTRKVIVPRVGKLSDASRGYLSRTKSIDIAKLRIPAHYARKVGKCSIATTTFQEAVRRVLREHEKRLVCVLDKHKIVENPYLEKAIKKYFRLGMLERTIKVSHLFGCANFDTETFGLSIAGCEHLQYVEYVPDLVWTTNLVPMLYCSSEKRDKPLYDFVTTDLFLEVYSEVSSIVNFVNSQGYFSMDSRDCLPSVVEFSCLS